jgi:hypothetical protein
MNNPNRFLLYAKAARRMTGRSRRDPELGFVVKALVVITLTSAMSFTFALHRHDADEFGCWLLALFTAVVATFGWTQLVREILKELNAIACLIRAQK